MSIHILFNVVFMLSLLDHSRSNIFNFRNSIIVIVRHFHCSAFKRNNCTRPAYRSAGSFTFLTDLCLPVMNDFIQYVFIKENWLDLKYTYIYCTFFGLGWGCLVFLFSKLNIPGVLDCEMDLVSVQI